MHRRIFATFFSLFCIIGGTVLAIRYAQGYRPKTDGTIQATGLLAANSFPNGASVYIDGKLNSATDSTIHLDPGTYEVEITKDGYTPWRKKITIEKELVTQTNAVLFPVAPSLTPLTFIGAENIVPSPDGQQILYTTASASASKSNGVFVLGMSDSPITFQRGPVQIAAPTSAFDFATAHFYWSPDSTQILLLGGQHTYLLASNRLNLLSSTTEVTATRDQIVSQWEDEFNKKWDVALALFPDPIQYLATASAKNVYISPDQERIIYTATGSSTLADNLLPPLPAANTQPQARMITTSGIYVYDRQEDRNFKIANEILPSPTPEPIVKKAKKTVPVLTPVTLTPEEKFEAHMDAFQRRSSAFFSFSPQWLPDSKHVVLASEQGIDVIEYDGTNRTRVYAGPFLDNLVYPWPNGSKLVILTNFNRTEDPTANLYALGIK